MTLTHQGFQLFRLKSESWVLKLFELRIQMFLLQDYCIVYCPQKGAAEMKNKTDT